jgi:hypothetical protein
MLFARILEDNLRIFHICTVKEIGVKKDGGKVNILYNSAKKSTSLQTDFKYK